MSVGCKIYRDFKRPDESLVKLFEGLQVANIDDCMDRYAAIDSAIRPLGKGQLLGVAFTVRVAEGDNLLFHAAMDLAKPGDVIMIDAGGFTNRAIVGELMSTYCKSRGVKGIVIDGSVRDSAALAEMDDFPVYARGISPNGPYKNGPGEINVPVVIGGKVVCPGDIVVGDADGVIIIKPEEAEALAKATKAVAEKEEAIIKHIEEDGTYIRPWLAPKLEEIGCEII